MPQLLTVSFFLVPIFDGQHGVDWSNLWKTMLRTLIRRLYGVHRCSGVERGLDGKDLASAYVLRPLGWLS
jgi:hypothetical protein